ncbi:hypothetical protein GCM10010975_10870 [Comamonas phosphati]|nr:hypothetical protein GCM10010975_10870 [Comamonas phosphati]
MPTPVAAIMAIPVAAAMPAAFIEMRPRSIPAGARPLALAAPVPVRRRVAQKINRLAAGVVAPAIAAPVARVLGRHPHIDGLLGHHHGRRGNQHGLLVQQRRRRIAYVHAPIDAWSQLPGNRAADIGLGLCQAGGARQSDGRRSAKRRMQ